MPRFVSPLQVSVWEDIQWLKRMNKRTEFDIVGESRRWKKSCFLPHLTSDQANFCSLFAAGGITHDTFQKELMCFDPDADKWTQKAPMTTVRGLHCMCTVGDRLYVIGGNHFRGTSDYDDVLSCEYYSPALDLWTPIAAMLRGQSDVGVAVFENKIYVVGGYSWNNRCMVEIVQRYDPEKDEWHKVFDLPESLGGIRACTLTVFPPEDISGSPSRESPLAAPWWEKMGVPSFAHTPTILAQPIPSTETPYRHCLHFLFGQHLYCISKQPPSPLSLKLWRNPSPSD